MIDRCLSFITTSQNNKATGNNTTSIIKRVYDNFIPPSLKTIRLKYNKTK